MQQFYSVPNVIYYSFLFGFQALPIFYHLRVMVIYDMIYLIHVKELAEHARSSLKSEQELLFVDLEHDPPKVAPG